MAETLDEIRARAARFNPRCAWTYVPDPLARHPSALLECGEALSYHDRGPASDHEFQERDSDKAAIRTLLAEVDRLALREGEIARDAHRWGWLRAEWRDAADELARAAYILANGPVEFRRIA